jgi:hypothetical protein
LVSGYTASSQISAKEWWGSRRFRYNVGLVIAGVLAFACYVGVVSWGISIGAMPDAEITLFTTAFQGVGYLLMMVVANGCYSLGSFSERILKPTDLERYRRIAFRLGFGFSVLLPFSIPAFPAYLCVTHPAWWRS